MSNQAAPGPWRWAPADDGHVYVFDGDGNVVAQLGMVEGFFASARLLAAAPDLLAALIAAEEDLDDVPGREDPPSLAIVRAAIAKTKGGG
jgi:hypothetical protein